MVLEAVHIAGGSYANKAETDRRMFKRLVATPGDASIGGGVLAGFQFTPKVGSLGLDVSAGEGVVDGKSTAGQGAYYVVDDSVGSIVWPAPSAQPRIDALVLAIGDTQYGALGAGMGGTVGPKWVVVQGTPAASPSAPSDAAITTAIGAGGWVRCLNVTIPVGATAILAGNMASIWQFASGNVYNIQGITYGSGWTGPLILDYRSGWCYLSGSVGKASWTSGELAATIPVGYRYPGLIYWNGVGTNTGQPVSGYIDAAGGVRVSIAASTHGSIGMCASWPLRAS